MANTLTGLFETLVVPAATQACQAAKFKNTLLERVYTDFRSLYGTVGQTMQINVPIVNEGNVSNIASGALSISNATQATTSITIGTNASSSRRIQSFDAIRSPLDLKTLYLDAMIEEVLRYSNRAVANLANPSAGVGILSVNSAITSSATSGSNEYLRADLAKAWEVLVTNGAPLTPEGASFVVHPVAYGNMLADTSNNWIQNYVVGEQAAVAAQQHAMFMPQFNMALDYDQVMPSTATPKYIGLAFHKFAIGLLPVLQPKTESDVVREVTVFPRPDFPVRVQLFYDGNAQGWVIHVNAVFGLGVVRPEFAVQVIAA